MITWNHPEQFTKTTIERHPVNLPFLGGRVEVKHTDASGARMEWPHIHMHAESVDCDWHIVLRGDAGTQADAGLMPQNVRAMDKDFRLVFADGRRFELLTQKREPIADAAQAARELRLARNRGLGETAAIIDAVKTEGTATRETVTGGFRGMLERVGIVRKRAGWPRVSLKARKRAAALWGGWSVVSLNTGRGGAKVDCFEYYQTELAGYKIESVEHFKAVIDAARK